MKVILQKEITEVVIIQPAKITLELTPSEAAIIRATIGALRTDTDSPLNGNIDSANIYRELSALVHHKNIPDYTVCNEFLRERKE